ncbi:PLP-dependent aminotransferase family protein [Kiloniella sp. EL199]|uniref:aminotransferase-like domain-containing protein n=1 Tax=Kiloniella sp. EL199 TaxID=2107581 RepID=UPI000EA1732E|nr:PLP-dependent aminotransferase family protein [Kiloniella sp. EL199]
MWLPKTLKADGPRYLAILSALEADIASGAVEDGLPLAPQRELAFQLGISVGTVVRAYSIAKQRGLVSGEVGRGTFVNARKALAEEDYFGDGSGHFATNTSDQIDLSLNISPPLREADQIGNALRSISGDAQLAQMIRYGVHLGPQKSRRILAEWVTETSHDNLRPSPEQIALSGGAQQAIWAICSGKIRPGDTILAESSTFAGIKSVAGLLGATVHGVDMDEQGLLPDALDKAISLTNARILYVMPTLQNPTGITMPEERRKAILSVVAKNDILVIEDDVYGFLKPDAPPPLAAKLPEKVYYVSSFSKSVAPGLRVGYCVFPDHMKTGIEAALRATCWMNPPIMSELVMQLIERREIESIVTSRISTARSRLSIAREKLGSTFPDLDWSTPRYHLWLSQPDNASAERFVRLAQEAGVLVSPPETVASDASSPSGIRVCLGCPLDEETLIIALDRMTSIDFTHWNFSTI